VKRHLKRFRHDRKLSDALRDLLARLEICEACQQVEGPTMTTLDELIEKFETSLAQEYRFHKQSLESIDAMIKKSRSIKDLPRGLKTGLRLNKLEQEHRLKQIEWLQSCWRGGN
jgi:hypothetical protein